MTSFHDRHHALLRLYRRFFPARLRRSSAMARLKTWVLGPDALYTAQYYEHGVEGPATASAPAMAASIVRDLAPRSVIDVGCGTGALLAALRERGCEVLGVDGAAAALDACRRRQLEVRRVDLGRARWRSDRSFDVALSLEVAEHLPRRAADRYVDLLASLAPALVFSAATPGQGGLDHRNEQPHSYWIEKLARRGLRLDRRLTDCWRDEWRRDGDVVWWYTDNLLVFRRPAASEGPSGAPDEARS